MTILSPHRDDAAFSCGLLMSLCAERGVPVRIVNFFTRSSYAPQRAEGLAEVGDSLLKSVTAVRLAEDEALVRKLGALCRLDDLDLVDAPLRLELSVEQILSRPLGTDRMRAESDRVARELAGRLDGADELIFAPLALGSHVDHEIVRDAALAVVEHTQLALYEDLPYVARLSDAERLLAISAVLGEAAASEPITAALCDGEDNGARKHELASLYPSQIDAGVMDEMAQYSRRTGGERFYACAGGAVHLPRLLETREAS